jgi:hypothetical protein
MSDKNAITMQLNATTMLDEEQTSFEKKIRLCGNIIVDTMLNTIDVLVYVYGCLRLEMF